MQQTNKLQVSSYQGSIPGFYCAKRIGTNLLFIFLALCTAFWALIEILSVVTVSGDVVGPPPDFNVGREYGYYGRFEFVRDFFIFGSTLFALFGMVNVVLVWLRIVETTTRLSRQSLDVDRYVRYIRLFQFAMLLAVIIGNVINRLFDSIGSFNGFIITIICAIIGVSYVVASQRLISLMQRSAYTAQGGKALRAKKFEPAIRNITITTRGMILGIVVLCVPWFTFSVVDSTADWRSFVYTTEPRFTLVTVLDYLIITGFSIIAWFGGLFVYRNVERTRTRSASYPETSLQVDNDTSKTGLSYQKRILRNGNETGRSKSLATATSRDSQVVIHKI